MRDPPEGAAGPLLPTATYAEAYARLSAIADRLRGSGGAADVDTLAQDIREARAAHAVCRSRLEAVREQIEAELASYGPPDAGA